MNKNLDGWLFVDKPIGISSNHALQKIRKIFNNCKAGYIGTLDPLASGCLPIALGSATKIIRYIEKYDKTYLFTVNWGIKTQTGDSEGKIVITNNKYPSEQLIKKELPNFHGYLDQITPKFSSVKIKGMRAYQLARKNIDFRTKNRKVLIKNINLLRVISKSKAMFSVECGSGTYVRSLAESLAKALGTVGTITELRRIRFGNYNKKLISLDYLLSLVHDDQQNKLVQPIDVVFDKPRKIQLDDKQVEKVLTGNFIEMNKCIIEKNEKKDSLVFAKQHNKFIALGLVEKKNFHPKKLLIS